MTAREIRMEMLGWIVFLAIVWAGVFGGLTYLYYQLPPISRDVLPVYLRYSIMPAKNIDIANVLTAALAGLAASFRIVSAVGDGVCGKRRN